MTINANKTVRELAVAVPGATRIFEEFGIDYCCGGHHTITDACEVAQVHLEEILISLEQARRSAQTNKETTNWQAEPLSALTAYIVDKHHVFTKQELTRLEQLLGKVCSVHGQNHAELLRLRTLFQSLSQELIPHMLKEEQMLFPYINRLEEAASQGQAVLPPFFGTVGNPVRIMMLEHESAGEVLREMRALTGNYTVPPDGCISYQTLYQALAAFEEDLHEHIHLENNILFPGAEEVEAATRLEWQAAAMGD
jgi:regulator of cell morphogenesis and NO signaling